MWEGVTVVRKCDSPKEVCQLPISISCVCVCGGGWGGYQKDENKGGILRGG